MDLRNWKTLVAWSALAFVGGVASHFLMAALK